MKLLLDTHTFLWWCLDDPQLSQRARETISDGENEVFLSVASVWEIVIKARLGKLELPEPPDQFVPTRLERHSILPLGLIVSHALAVSQLDDIHRDPFDRLLVAQCLVENIALVSGDPILARYPVTIVW